MEQMKYTLIFFASALLLCANCTITTVNIPQKTALENQLMGEFSPLTEEELLLASVRSDYTTASMQPVLEAKRRQLFNRDDIREFKTQGCLGESLDARLTLQECTRTDLDSQSLLKNLVKQENEDRQTIIQWFISNDPTLAHSDKPQVITIYRQLLVTHSPMHTPIQVDTNNWTPKAQ